MKITLNCRKAIVLDWNNGSHWNGGKRLLCIHCGLPTMLLDDASRPSHKTCAETALAELINKRNGQAAA